VAMPMPAAKVRRLDHNARPPGTSARLTMSGRQSLGKKSYVQSCR
jgi:hypothetical protein